MTPIACRFASPWVSAVASGDEVRFTPAYRHISTCLRCQALAARERRLHRSLSDLADETLPAPTPLRPVGDPTGRTAPRTAVFAAGAVAVAAGVAGYRLLRSH